MSATASASNAVVLRLELVLADPAAADILAAELFECGALGIEERAEVGGRWLLIYLPDAALAAARAAFTRWSAPGDRWIGATPVEAEDWGESWKRHARAVIVSPRLRIRPSWLQVPPCAGIDLRIDPAQAFGTGAHDSTRLALEWIDSLSYSAPRRVLDVGCGSGVLALAACALGAGRALAFDLDPLAARATRRAASENGLDDRIDVLCGPIDAISPARGFDCVIANLLKREMLPLLRDLRRLCAPGARAIFSGLLVEDLGEVLTALEASGLQRRGLRSRRCGGEDWASLFMQAPGVCASPR